MKVLRWILSALVLIGVACPAAAVVSASTHPKGCRRQWVEHRMKNYSKSPKGMPRYRFLSETAVYVATSGCTALGPDTVETLSRMVLSDEGYVRFWSATILSNIGRSAIPARPRLIQASAIYKNETGSVRSIDAIELALSNIPNK